MSGQFGFQATDPVPPHPGPTFAAEDIEELGLDGCLKVWRRMNDGRMRRDVPPDYFECGMEQMEQEWNEWIRDLEQQEFLETLAAEKADRDRDHQNATEDE